MAKRNKNRRGGRPAQQPQKPSQAQPVAPAAEEAPGAEDAAGVEDIAAEPTASAGAVDDAGSTHEDAAAGAIEIRQTAAPAPDAPVGDIRGVLIQVAGSRLLLPNATIAEVLSYADPEPVAGAPDWLLGRIRWRGWQLPLVAFARLTGIATDEQGGLGSKVLVVKAFGGNPKLPFFALLTQGFPRLVTVSQDGLVRVEPDGALPDAVHAAVMLNEDEALLPDIGRVEALLADALSKAA
jgi:chemosensory pili system protein ChpC